MASSAEGDWTGETKAKGDGSVEVQGDTLAALEEKNIVIVTLESVFDEPNALEADGEKEEMMAQVGIYPISAKEIEILERIVEAEAGGEDDDGKLLVANVVLNRVRDDAFPESIEEVVFQQDGGVTQFSPVANGRYHSVTVSEESREAVRRALMGEDISEGALYFAARKYANPKEPFEKNFKFL